MQNTNYRIQRAVTGTPGVFFQCDYMHVFRFTPFTAPEERRCGKDAAYALFYKGALTGSNQSKHLCEEHAQEYLDSPKVIKEL